MDQALTAQHPSPRGARGGGSKMRTARQRPTSQHGAQPQVQTSALPPRKIFNCIVDDTALVAGVKNATRNGIRQWVKNGQIRLFVPLHAIDELQKQKRSDTRHGRDVEDTLKWLDDATTKYPWAVTLQGGDQYYTNWAEVERFAVPRPLFSENDHVEDAEPEPEPEPETDGLAEETGARLTLLDEPHKSPVSSAASINSGSASPSSLQSARSSMSPVSPPPRSPKKASPSPARTVTSPASPSKSTSSSGMVPIKLQPLFNYILWRIHQELDPVAALESFIFLCNDAEKVHFARGFDIKYKRLEQLREVVGREDRDFRNRLGLQNRENQQTSTPAGITVPQHSPQQDGEVVYDSATRVRAATIPKEQPSIIDPNAFDRKPMPVAQPGQTSLPPRSPRQNTAQPVRGGPTSPLSPRGNARDTFRGSQRGRGNFGPGRGGGFVNNRTSPSVQQGGQIDPDSFVRPRGGNVGRGGRKLWEPE